MGKILAKMKANRLVVASVVVSVLTLAGANLDVIRAISDTVTTFSSALQVAP